MLDLEEYPNGVSKMKISATPTLIKYKNGKEEKILFISFLMLYSKFIKVINIYDFINTLNSYKYT